MNKLDKFLSHAVKLYGCWSWVGSKSSKGYGQVSRSFYGEGLAHRASWLLHKGVIPPGLFVCHRCNNPSCVNPDHLYLATNSQNIKDAWRDGLGSNQNTVKARCPKCGSDFERSKIGRYCPQCKAASDKRTKIARAAKRRPSLILRRGRSPSTISLGGRDMTITEWGKEIGIGYETIRQRLKAGWPVELALSRNKNIRPFTAAMKKGME